LQASDAANAARIQELEAMVARLQQQLKERS
jgi:hypothetical protein